MRTACVCCRLFSDRVKWYKSPEVTSMQQLYKVPLILSPQPEGGYTVTSPVLPELVTEGNTVEEALNNADSRTNLEARINFG